jgi:hypothetical protein
MLEILKLVVTAMVGSGAAITLTKLFFDWKKEKRERLGITVSGKKGLLPCRDLLVSPA